MNRATRTVSGLTGVLHGAHDPSGERAVRAASLAALTLAVRAAQARAPIGEPLHAGAPPLYAGGPGCPPTG